jgi:hypothetical protein
MNVKRSAKWQRIRRFRMITSGPATTPAPKKKEER